MSELQNFKSQKNSVFGDNEPLNVRQQFSIQDPESTRLSIGAFNTNSNGRHTQITAQRGSSLSSESQQVAIGHLSPPQISLPQKIIIKMKERKQHMQQKQKMIKEVVNC